MTADTDVQGTSERSAPRLGRLERCPVCTHETSAFAFASLDLLHGVPGLFAYEQCQACLSFFQNPRADERDLALCYPSDYFTHGATAAELTRSAGTLQLLVRSMVLRSGAHVAGSSWDVGKWCGHVLRLVPPIRRRALFGLVSELMPPVNLDTCLEIGPGTGDDMWRLSQLGWKVTGIDLDAEAGEVAQARSGCPVVVGSILDHRTDQPYGLIYGSHSLEHLPDLRGTIAHLHSLLGRGGRLVLIIPNAMSVTARVYGPLSVVWDPPRHLSLPSLRALELLLRESGFREVRIRTTAQRAGHYSGVARARRRGVTGSAAWSVTASRSDRVLHSLEALLVRAGLDVGEEIVVSATR